MSVFCASFVVVLYCLRCLEVSRTYLLDMRRTVYMLI